MLWACLREYKRRLYITQQLTTLQEEARFYQHQVSEYQRREKQESSTETLKTVIESACHQALSGFQTSCLTVLQPAVEHWNQTQVKEHKHILSQTTNPIGEALAQVLNHLKGIEHERLSTYEHLKSHILRMGQDQKELTAQTQNLVTALRSPNVRGSWGELQLRRVLELSGMLEHCDFEEQFTLKQGHTVLKPDVIIRLTENRCIIIDAKAPIVHYLEAYNAADTKMYEEKLQEHTRLLTHHIKKLSEKAYPKHCPGSVDFVVLFVPGDNYLSAALAVNPSLTEWASERNVVLASPSLLIALLKTIAHGWRQERLAEHTKHIMDLASQLLNQCHVLEKKFDSADRHLRQSSEAFLSASQILKFHVMSKAHALESCAENTNHVTENSTPLEAPTEI